MNFNVSFDGSVPSNIDSSEEHQYLLTCSDSSNDSEEIFESDNIESNLDLLGSFYIN
jgi:hypothetical protein